MVEVNTLAKKTWGATGAAGKKDFRSFLKQQKGQAQKPQEESNEVQIKDNSALPM